MIVPAVAPLLVLQLADAQQVAVLLLMVLQAGFLLPATVHQLDASTAAAPAPASESEDDLARRMRDMGPSPSPEDGPTVDTPGAAPSR